MSAASLALPSVADKTSGAFLLVPLGLEERVPAFIGEGEVKLHEHHSQLAGPSGRALQDSPLGLRYVVTFPGLKNYAGWQLARPVGISVAVSGTIERIVRHIVEGD